MTLACNSLIDPNPKSEKFRKEINTTNTINSKQLKSVSPNTHFTENESNQKGNQLRVLIHRRKSSSVVEETKPGIKTLK